MPIDIAPATESDLPAVAALAGENSLRRVEPGHAERNGFLVSEFTLDDYRILFDTSDHFYVASENGELVGFLLAYSSDRIQPKEWLNARIRERIDRPFVLIKQIVVSSRHRSKGVATGLYRHLFSITDPVPVCSVIVLEPINTRSIEFHERLGFTLAARSTPPDGIPRGVWLYRMAGENHLFDEFPSEG